MANFEIILAFIISLAVPFTEAVGPCNAALGVGSGVIQDFQISSSSAQASASIHSPPWKARADSSILGNEGDSFVIEDPAGGWIQIDLIIEHFVTSMTLSPHVGVADILYSNQDAAPAYPDSWITYSDPYTYASGLLTFAPEIQARYLRLLTASSVTIDEIELYGCTTGKEAADEILQENIVTIGAYDGGCQVFVILTDPIQLTALDIYTNISTNPADGQVTVYSVDSVTGNRTHVPIDESLNDNTILTITLGHGINTKSIEVYCDPTWGACYSMTVYGRRLQGCPPTFAQHDSNCYRVVPYSQPMETEEEKDICARMNWEGSLSTGARPYNLTTFHFLDYYVDSDANAASTGLLMTLYNNTHLAYEMPGEPISFEDGFNLENFINIDARNIAIETPKCSYINGLLGFDSCTTGRPYVCETRQIEPSTTGCDWMIQKSTQATHTSQRQVTALFLSECMYLCQASNCSSVSYSSTANECYLSDLHTDEADFALLSEQTGWTTLDWYCFEDENAACVDDVTNCINADCLTDKQNFCALTCDRCSEKGCGRPLLAPNMQNDVESSYYREHYVSSPTSGTTYESISAFWVENTLLTAWKPDLSDQTPFINITFNGVMRITKIFIACGMDDNCGTEQFYLSSHNGSISAPVIHADKWGNIKYYEGCTNGQQDTRLVALNPAIHAESLIIHLHKALNTEFCFQCEIYGCQLNTAASKPYTALGIGSDIEDFQLTADYFVTNVSLSPPWRVRPNQPVEPVRLENTYLDLGDEGTWFQIDFITLHVILALEFASVPSGSQLKTYKIHMSNTTEFAMTPITDAAGSERVFNATNMINPIGEGIEAKIIRILPIRFTSDRHLRLEVYGHPVLTGCPAMSQGQIASIASAVTGDLCLHLTESGLCIDAYANLSLTVTFNGYFDIHGVTVVYHNRSTAQTLDIATRESSTSSYVMADTVAHLSETNDNAINYVLTKKLTALEVALRAFSTVQEYMGLYIHACPSKQCPPGYTQHKTKCYQYRRGAATLLLPDDDNPPGLECHAQDWVGVKAHLAQFDEEIIPFLTSLTASTAEEKLYVGATQGDPFLTSTAASDWSWITSSALPTPLTWLEFNDPSHPYGSERCTAVNSVALVDVACATFAGYLCELSYPRPLLYTDYAWTSTSHSTLPSAELLDITQYAVDSVTTCMSYCTDKELESLCSSVLYDVENSTCSLLPFMATELVTLQNIHYFEFIHERRIDVANLQINIEEYDPLMPVVPLYNFAFNVQFELYNNDTVDLNPAVGDGAENFVLKLFSTSDSFVNEAAGTPLDESLLIVQTFDLETTSSTNGIPAMSSISMDGSGVLNVNLAYCEEITHVCLAVFEGDGGRLMILPSAHSNFQCLAIPVDFLLHCDGLPITDHDLISSVASDDATARLEPVHFTITWSQASDMECVFDYGDATDTAHYAQEREVADLLDSNFTISHAFLEPGLYIVGVSCGNRIEQLTAQIGVAVEVPLAESLAITEAYTPASVPLTVMYTLEASNTYPYTADIYTNCTFDLYNDGVTLDDSVFESFVSPGTPIDYETSYGIDNEHGYAETTVFCQNHISNLTFNFVITIREDITDVAIALAQPAYEVNTMAYFDVTVVTGSHVELLIDYGDGSGMVVEPPRYPLIDYDDGSGIVVEPPRYSLMLNPNSWNINHTYTAIGNYTVTVYNAFNIIYDTSLLPLQVEIAIQNVLIDLELRSDDFTLYPPAAIVFDLVEGPLQDTVTDVHCTWYLDYDGIEWYTNAATLVTSFSPDPAIVRTRDEFEPLIGNCSNMISYQLLDTSFYTYIDDIVVVSAGVSEPDWWRNTTTLTVELEKLHSPATIYFLMGDYYSTMCMLNYPQVENIISPVCNFTVNILPSANVQIILRYLYPEFSWGDFIVEMIGTNAHAPLYDISHDLDVTVWEWTCFPPTITLGDEVSSGSYTVFKGEDNSFDVTVLAIDCMKTEHMLYTWSILDTLGVEMISGLHVSSANFTLPARHLDYGVYTIKCTVTMDVDVSIFSDNGLPVNALSSALFEVIPTPVVAILQNSDTPLEVNHNRILTLDGSGTHDPDLDPPFTPNGITYEWHCLQQVPVDTPNVGNPATQVSSMCGVTLTPLLYNTHTVNIDIQALVAINSPSLAAEYSYVFQMTASKNDGRSPTPPVQGTVTVLTSAAPDTQVVCESGCTPHHDSTVVTIQRRKVFSYSCNDSCETVFGGLSQRWALYQLDEQGNVFDLNQNLALQGYLMTVNSVPRVTIAPDMLEGNSMYMIAVDSWTPGSLVGRADFTFWVAEAPFGGTCIAHPPLAGLLMLDTFRMTCEGWQRWVMPGTNDQGPFEFDYELSYRDTLLSSTEQLLFGNNEIGEFESSFFPVGSLSLTADVEDEFGGIARIADFGEIMVFPLNFSSVTSLTETLSPMVEALDPSDVYTLNRIVGALTSVMNNWDPHTSDPEDTYDESYEYRIEQLVNMREQIQSKVNEVEIDMNSFRYVSQMTHGLADVHTQISDTLMHQGLSKHLNMSGYLIAQMQDGDVDAINGLASVSLSTINHLVQGSTTLTVDENRNSTNSETLVTALKMASVSIHGTLDGFLNKTSEGEQEEVIGTGINLKVSKGNASDVYGNTLHVGDANIAVPVSAGQESGCTSTKLFLSTGNSKVYGNGSSGMNSDLLITNIEDTCIETPSRRRRSVDDEEPIYEYSLPVRAAETYEINDIYAHSEMIWHNLDIEEEPRNIILTVYPRESLMLDVYINYDTHPTMDDFFYMVEIPQVNITIPDDATEEHIYELERTIYIPADNVTDNNATSIHIGVMINGCEGGLNNCTVRNELLYRYGISYLQCQNWNADLEEWDTSNCQIEEGTTGKTAKFKSNLLGSLGAGVFVGPNMIDFNTVFDDPLQKLADSAAVIGTVVGVIIIFIPLCVLARLYDKKDKLKWSILPLVDNESEDEHEYEVHVYTGLKGNAGTRSAVSIVVAGTESDSGVRRLEDGVRDKKFGQGDVTSFLMLIPDSLGDPVTLKVWHDNSGEARQASWFLSKIVVVDFKHDRWYVFLCDSWLAIDEGDGSLERTLHVSSTEEITSSTSLLHGNMKRQLFDDHLWLSVGYRKTRSTFTRVQRLCCCLVILFLTMIANAMWYKDGNADSEDGETSASQSAISIGPINLTVVQVYASIASSIMIVPPILIITTIFAKAKPKDSSKGSGKITAKAASEREDTQKSSSKKLPWWSIIIAYVLIVAAVVASGFFTILYAFQWGKAKSEAWLVTFLLSFVESVLLIQPLKVVIVSVLLTFLLKKDTEVSDYEKDLGKMEERNPNNKATQDNLVETAKVLTEEEKLEAKKSVELDKKFKAMIREVILQLSLLLLMYWVIVGNVKPESIYQNTNIKNIFLDGFPEDGDKGALVGWMKETFIENLYFTENYIGTPANIYNKKFISDSYAMRLGPPRLRLLRVKPEKCDIPGKLSSHIEQCVLSYSESNEDKRDYLPEWRRNRTERQDAGPSDSFGKSFLYQSESQLKGIPFWGERAVYSGGGYVANLGIEKEAALELIDQLVDANWINPHTRAVFVEFNIWNANTNLFNLVLICVELQSEGGFSHKVTIETVVLYRYVGAGGLVALLAEIILTILVIAITVKEILKIVRHGIRYFAQFWNVVLVVAIILFYTGLALYVWRSVLTASTVEEMMNNRDETINFAMVSNASKYYIIIMGWSAFLIQMGLLHILRYNKTIAQLGQTLQDSAKDLINVGVCMFISIVAFASFMYFYFGPEVSDYRSVKQTFSSLVSGSLGKFNYSDVDENIGALGSLMLLFYLFFMLYFMMSIFMSVLCDYITAVKTDPNSVPKDHEVMDYMIKYLKATVGLGEEKTHKYDVRKRRKSARDLRLKDRDSDHLLTRLANLEKLTTVMEPRPMTRALSKLLEGFLAQRKPEKYVYVEPLTSNDEEKTSVSSVDLMTQQSHASLNNIDPSLQKEQNPEEDDLDLILRTILLKRVQESLVDKDSDPSDK